MMTRRQGRFVTLVAVSMVTALPIAGALTAAWSQNRPTAAARMQAAVQTRLRPPPPGSIVFNDRSPRLSNHNLSGATYVGIERCAGCHGRLTSTRRDHTIIDEWEGRFPVEDAEHEMNPHAKDPAALHGTLNLYNRGPITDGHPAVDLEGNPVEKRCDTCHSTGAPGFDPSQQKMIAGEVRGGFDNSKDWWPLVAPRNSPPPPNWDVHVHNMKLGRVQCENCHGPGSKHVLSGGDPMFINRVPNPQDTCFQCHRHQPNEKGNLITAPATDDLIALYSSSLAHGHSGATLLAGTGGYEYPGEDYSAGHNHPHTRITAACVTCHLPRDPRSPILNHSNILPKIEACRNCHGDARSVPNVEDWSYLQARQAVVNVLLIQLGGADAAGNPDFNARGGLLGNAADKNSLEYKRARWNHSTVVNDSSSGAHNYDYAIELLTTSITHAPAQRAP
jgi:hypothetical protein